jgi:hypothetical protein
MFLSKSSFARQQLPLRFFSSTTIPSPYEVLHLRQDSTLQEIKA